MKFRMRKIVLFLFFTVPILSCSTDPLKDEKTIEQFLISNNYKYTVDTEGDFKLTIPLDDQNTDTVWIRKELNYTDNRGVREIFSIGALLSLEQTEYLSSYLLQDNFQTRIMGNWAYMKDDSSNKVLLIYLIKLPVSTEKDYLESALREAAFAAEVMKSVVHVKD